MQFDASYEAQTVTLRIAGDIDLASVSALTEFAEAELGRADCTAVVLDISGVSFIDSTGLSALLRVHSRGEELNKPVRLRDPSESVRYLMLITGTTEFFTIEEPDVSR